MATKRPEAGGASGVAGARKRLRAADVILTTSSARAASGSGGSSTATPPVCCSIAAYGKSGAHASRHFPDTGRVWQVQLEHAARPSVTFAFLKNWLEYKNGIRRAAGREEARSLEGLEKDEGIRVVLTGADDEHGFGYKQWQCGLYVHDRQETGVDRLCDVLQDLALFFSFVRASAAYGSAPMPALEWATIDSELGTAMAEALESDDAWSQAKRAAHVFDLHPPFGKAGIALALEGTPSEDTVNLLMTGYTWPWRAAFDAANVTGGYVEESNGTKSYVRMLTGVRVEEDADAKRMQHLFQEVLRSYPVLLRPVDEEDRTNTAVAGARTHLLTLPSIWER